MRGAVKGNKNSVTTRNFIFKVQWIQDPSTCCGRMSTCVWCCELLDRSLLVSPLSVPRSSHCTTAGVTKDVVCTILTGTVHIKEL